MTFAFRNTVTAHATSRTAEEVEAQSEVFSCNECSYQSPAFEVCGRTDSNNRKQLKEDYYAVIALRKRTIGDVDYEEDLLSFLGVKSADEVTIFSRLQTRGAVIHSRSYKRVQGEITTLWFIRRETALVAKHVLRMHIHS